MANAVSTEVVKVENGDEPQVKSEDSTTEPAYVMEIEVNADGEVVKQTAHRKEHQEGNDANALPVTEVTVFDENEVDAIKSMHNYFQQPGASTDPGTVANYGKARSSEPVVGSASTDEKLLENIAKVVNSTEVSVLHDSGQVIVVLGQDCQLSDKDLEEIRLQISKTEEQQDSRESGNVPIPEPSCFTEQSTTSESSQSTDQHTTDKGDIRVCYQCKGEFESADELVLHFVQEHSTSVKCQYCDMVFPSIADANQHKKQRHIELQCTMCKKTYYGTQSLNHHIKIRHSKGTKCGTCYKYFDSRKEMEDHIEEVHKVHKCMFCRKGFYFQTSLANHIESEHGLSTFDTEINFDSTERIASTGRLQLTAQYEQTVQLESVTHTAVPNNKPPESPKAKPVPKYKPREQEQEEQDITPTRVHSSRRSPRKHVFKCDFCEEGFYFRTSLVSHVNSKHGDHSTVDTDTVDDLIGRTNHFADVEHLESNNTMEAANNVIKIEKPSPPNVAEVTPKLFNNKSSEHTVNGFETPKQPLRKSPRKRAAEDTLLSTKKSNQEKPGHSCEQCGVSFKGSPQNESVLMYTKHMAENHDDFQCKKCNVDFKNYRSFMTHMKSKHEMSTDVFVCAYCEQEFRTKRTYDVHTKDNWKRCPVAVGCTHCPQVFVSTKELTSHHKKEHKGKSMHYKV